MIIQSTRLSLQSSELASFASQLQASNAPPPPRGSKGGTHSLGAEGQGESNSHEGADTLVL
jgi:hypothetical protein